MLAGQDNCVQVLRLPSLLSEYGLTSRDPQNPVRDWNFIYVPYCDGSVHMGDNEADYDGNGQIVCRPIFTAWQV